MATPSVDEFEAQRPRLFGLAYRMLGEAGEADRMTSARARRETYIGPWLPEPVLTADGALGPLDTVEQRESVSLALLMLMERLTPTERAVFVLREAFSYSHRQIAELLDVSEANSRQLHARARQRLGGAHPRFEPDRAVNCAASSRWRSSMAASARCTSRPTQIS